MPSARQLVLAVDVDSESGLILNTYSWAAIPDQNSDGKAITCAFVPPAKSYDINPMQETMFLGTINADLSIQTFRRDLSQDGDEDVTAVAITNRLDPTFLETGWSDTKRFTHIEFPSVNPISKGLTVEYCREAESPHIEGTTWEEFSIGSNERKGTFPSGLAKWIHLRITDDTNLTNQEVFGSFCLYYYNLFSRTGESL